MAARHTFGVRISQRSVAPVFAVFLFASLFHVSFLSWPGNPTKTFTVRGYAPVMSVVGFGISTRPRCKAISVTPCSIVLIADITDRPAKQPPPAIRFVHSGANIQLASSVDRTLGILINVLATVIAYKFLHVSPLVFCINNTINMPQIFKKVKFSRVATYEL